MLLLPFEVPLPDAAHVVISAWPRRVHFFWLVALLLLLLDTACEGCCLEQRCGTTQLCQELTLTARGVNIAPAMFIPLLFSSTITQEAPSVTYASDKQTVQVHFTAVLM